MIKLSELLLELTPAQKELKKDYLFKQSKLKSSNQIPSFEEVWEILLMSDSVKDEIRWRSSRELLGLSPESQIESEDKVTAQVKSEQQDRYEDIIYSYKKLNGKLCWREIILPQSVNPRTLNQLGIYWAVEERSAEAYWGEHHGQKSFKCKYSAIINLDNVDWPGTIIARMDTALGDDEQEIRFLKNSKMFVKFVTVYDNVKDQTYDYIINDWRRA